MILHLALTLSSLFLSYQGNQIKDSFEINEPGYEGYIMPLHSSPLIKENGKSCYLPGQDEVKKAEDLLKIYLDQKCGKYDTIIKPWTTGYDPDCDAVKR